MKEGGRSVSAGRDRLRRALIVVEFALALTLLAGGGMAVHALLRTMNADLGFHAERRSRSSCRSRAPGSRQPARSRRSTGRCSSGRRRCPASPRCPCPPASRWTAPASAPGSRCRASGAVGQRRQHGDAGLLPHLRHRHGPRPAVDRRRSRRQHARRHRQPGLRQALPAGRRSDRPARHLRAVRERPGPRPEPVAVGDRRDPGRRRQRRPRRARRSRRSRCRSGRSPGRARRSR